MRETLESRSWQTVSLLGEKDGSKKGHGSSTIFCPKFGGGAVIIITHRFLNTFVDSSFV